MALALTVRRCQAYRGSVAGICGWSSWWKHVAGTTKKEKGKVKGRVGGGVPWPRACNPCRGLIYAGSCFLNHHFLLPNLSLHILGEGRALVLGSTHVRSRSPRRAATFGGRGLSPPSWEPINNLKRFPAGPLHVISSFKPLGNTDLSPGPTVSPFQNTPSVHQLANG